ncbi:MAG: CHAT domain-containing protein [Cyanobacteria bacterium J06638_6]
MAQKILFLAANPIGTSRLRLDQEVRDIEEGLRRSTNQQDFELVTKWAVRAQDIRRALLDENPSIIHFSGHGDGGDVATGSSPADARKLTPINPEVGSLVSHIIVEDDQGNPRPYPPEALANLFKLFADQIDCVVLNACYSKGQAEAIAAHVPYVIGTQKAIGDRAAIEFAVGFYDGLGAGRAIEFAFALGCSAIEGAGLNEQLTPILVPGNVAPRSTAESSASNTSEDSGSEQTPGTEGIAGIAIPQDRIKLYQFLMDLPDTQFEQMINALKPPSGNVPPSHAPRGQRVPALFEWLESPIGPGLETLRSRLRDVLNP